MKPVHKLAPREESVAKMLAYGMTAKEIAHDTGKSTKTIESQRTAIYRKLGIDRVTDLTFWALRTGLIEL